ncbi:MAG TPA: hypothetical protein VJT50_03170, partial [Pyrinomonadaceae bacterium]|nr:hypothetical protein [Pyrinomonadaceae bacterium]
MSDPISNDYVPPPPPPPLTEAAVAPRNTKLRMPAIVLAVLGVLIAIGGIAKLIPGGVATGAAFVFFGIVLFALSFIRLPAVADSEPEMSTGARLAGIFYEPSRVFRSLRSHPTWLAPF